MFPFVTGFNLNNPIVSPANSWYSRSKILYLNVIHQGCNAIQSRHIDGVK